MDWDFVALRMAQALLGLPEGDEAYCMSEVVVECQDGLRRADGNQRISIGFTITLRQDETPAALGWGVKMLTDQAYDVVLDRLKRSGLRGIPQELETRAEREARTEAGSTDGGRTSHELRPRRVPQRHLGGEPRLRGRWSRRGSWGT